MDVKYINPFIDATINVFTEFFGIIPEVQKPYLMKLDEEHDWDVSAIIGIAGQAKGAVVISFTKKMAAKLTSILVKKEIKDVDIDVVDTIGEVVNIITGNAKKGLEEYRLMISLPSIIKGNNHRVAWPSKTIPNIGIPFKTPHGQFTLSVALGNIIKV